METSTRALAGLGRREMVRYDLVPLYRLFYMPGYTHGETPQAGFAPTRSNQRCYDEVNTILLGRIHLVPILVILLSILRSTTARISVLVQ
jgi:hypothetical protein